MAQLQRLPRDAGIEEMLEALKRDGGVIVEEVLERSEVEAINRDLDREIGALPEGNWARDAETWIADFQGYRTKRLQHCVSKSATYREAFVGSAQIAELLSAVLTGGPGSHSLFASQAIEIWPGEKAQVLHRDAQTLHGRVGTFHADAPELLVNSILALNDITEDMGATRVIPGSHAVADFEREGDPAETVGAAMNAGDVLFLTGRLYHGGGANVTRDRPRRVISTTWTAGFFKSEEAWHHAVPLEEARDYPEIVQRYLGLFSPSFHDERPGFLWRVDSVPLEEHLGLVSENAA